MADDHPSTLFGADTLPVEGQPQGRLAVARRWLKAQGLAATVLACALALLALLAGDLWRDQTTAQDASEDLLAAITHAQASNIARQLALNPDLTAVAGALHSGQLGRHGGAKLLSLASGQALWDASAAQLGTPTSAAEQRALTAARAGLLAGHFVITEAHGSWNVAYRVVEASPLVVLAWTSRRDHRAQWLTGLALKTLIFSLACLMAVLLGLHSMRQAAKRRGPAGDLISKANRAAIEMVAAVEREQSRLGRELHDGLGQQLTGLAFLGNVMERKLREASNPAADDAAWMVRLLNESVAQTRAIAHGLQPVEAGERALFAALTKLCNDAQALYGVNCSFVNYAMEIDLAQDATNHIYRIAQEALNNAVRHGGARHIEINTRIDPHGAFEMEVWNDGDPPKLNAIERSDGIGLAGMKLRAQLAGGTLSFDPHLISGFSVAVILPGVGPQTVTGENAP